MILRSRSPNWVSLPTYKSAISLRLPPSRVGLWLEWAHCRGRNLRDKAESVGRPRARTGWYYSQARQARKRSGGNAGGIMRQSAGWGLLLILIGVVMNN